jgi:phage FluMu protein Com
MRIMTLRCPSCGTVVAGNVLEDRREVKCPGLGCKEVLRFSDLEEADREHILANREQYRIE